jgi:hypothetical protein
MLWMLVTSSPVRSISQQTTPLAVAYVLAAFHGSDFMGERLTVQFARGTRNREFAPTERTAPRPRRTPHRMQISGLPGETSWQVCNPRSFTRMIGSENLLCGL